MTTNVVLCTRCRTQVSNQHLYFTDTNDLRSSAAEALCDAHKFMARWEDSPHSDQIGDHGCYNCGHGNIALRIDYNFVTEGEGLQASDSNHLTVNLTRDLSDVRHYDSSFEIEITRAELMDEIRFYVAHRARAHSEFMTMLAYPNTTDDRPTIENSETLDRLIDTVRSFDATATCDYCSIDHSAYVI